MHRSAEPEWWSWTYTEELLAELIEVMDFGNRLYLQAHTKPGAHLPDPIRIPRPYDREQPKAIRRRATGDEVIAMFEAKGGKVVKDAPS